MERRVFSLMHGVRLTRRGHSEERENVITVLKLATHLSDLMVPLGNHKFEFMELTPIFRRRMIR